MNQFINTANIPNRYTSTKFPTIIEQHKYTLMFTISTVPPNITTVYENTTLLATSLNPININPSIVPNFSTALLK